MTKLPQLSVNSGGRRLKDVETAAVADGTVNGATATADSIGLIAESLEVSKQPVLSSTVRVSTKTERFEEIAEIALERDVVDVTRVSIGKLIEIVPEIRTVGETTVVPIVEERIAIVKQLYLKEEIHIRRRIESEIIRTPVQLRRQTATVERVDPAGQTIPDMPDPPETNA